MATTTAPTGQRSGATPPPPASVTHEKHPKGLYVLFATEMWERFGFYSMLALFTLYLRDADDGFGWTGAQATGLYSNYLMFVYASPLIGGWIADKKLGYRNSVLIGGVIFMIGYALFGIKSIGAVYAALACLVIGNGFFKPNVSTMVGNLYPEGSHLKDRAYNIFYMGINIGAFLAPLAAEFVRQRMGFRPAFMVAAVGMVFSVAILWFFKHHVIDRASEGRANAATRKANAAAVTEDAPPASISHQQAKQNAMEAVPESSRIIALIVVFAIVIVFWMVFHQNGSTLTYWADDNTDWNVSGTVSNAINPFWIISLTFPLVWFWKYLDERGKEPSTPTKMAIGMTLTALSFFILFAAARSGEGRGYTAADYGAGSFRLNERAANNLRAAGVPGETLDRLTTARDGDQLAVLGRKFSAHGDSTGQQRLMAAVGRVAGPDVAAQHEQAILRETYLFRVSPFWLILAYAVISLGELMLSPMGLSLVSKVAPIRLRGLMMGGWFVATAIGNKLTAIGVFWDRWPQSQFFAVLGGMALIMAFVLTFLLRPLKKAMPGV